MGRGIDRSKIFKKDEEGDFQSTAVVLSAGAEEDGLRVDGPTSSAPSGPLSSAVERNNIEG